MAKNIVICLDGTGNQVDEHLSNVVKLFGVMERSPAQVGYYDPGVGTLSDPAFKSRLGQKASRLFGLAAGIGLLRNVEQAYSYLMEHHEEGDRIFIFGFSRGAYSARVLAGFIHHCGLLEAGAQNLIPYALKLYTNADWGPAGRFRKLFGRRAEAVDGRTSRVELHFLGLFDTVSTFGWIWDPIFLPYTSNNRSVRAVRHALAVDERRRFYRQLAWGTKDRAAQDVKEVWFAGVHSDVGGSYAEAESGLGKIALEWMLAEARGFGLKVEEEAYRKYVLGEAEGYAPPSMRAEIHRSLKGLWWLAEVAPKRIWDPEEKRKAFRWPKPNRPRTIPDEPRPVVHETVLERMQALPYQPPNLPPLDQIAGRFDVEPAGS